MSAPDHSATSGVKDELSALLEDLVELASSATGMDREKLAELKQGLHDRVEQVGASAKDAATDAASSIKARATETMDRVDSFAHEKPWHLALAAGLIGLAVGVMVARK
jgi:ElaB/YqjD/DUF883 family membrane-anchored ribosome-binding protein